MQSIKTKEKGIENYLNLKDNYLYDLDPFREWK
jgi:hypothetical protein